MNGKKICGECCFCGAWFNYEDDVKRHSCKEMEKSEMKNTINDMYEIILKIGEKCDKLIQDNEMLTERLSKIETTINT